MPLPSLHSSQKTPKHLLQQATEQKMLLNDFQYHGKTRDANLIFFSVNYRQGYFINESYFLFVVNPFAFYIAGLAYAYKTGTRD